MSPRKKTNAQLSVVARSANYEDYKSIPALAAYIARVAGDGEVEQRSFKRFVLIGESDGGYKRDRAIITVARDGTVTAPEALKPTDDEAKAIKNAVSLIDFPRSVPATRAGAARQRTNLAVREEDWFEILDASRAQVLMCQQRVDKKDWSKTYLPWTRWSDGTWRRMEPEGDGLPMWKPPERRGKLRIMVHEGAKAARYVDWLVNAPEASEQRAKQPWAVDLGNYEHWGWIGGAPNPQRTDWSELPSDVKEIVIVADNDLVGQQAVKPIARALSSSKAAVAAVMFDDAFPPSFDLADDFPRKFWISERYRGPTLADCCRPATWATRKIDTEAKGRPLLAARTAFIDQWVASIVPAVFVHRRYPNRLLDAAQFNTMMLPFSDAKDTAAVLAREAAAQVDGVAYEPGRNQGVITMDGLRLINTWKPAQVPRRKGDVTIWLNFMGALIVQQQDRDQVLRWCATLIARPDIRMRYGLLLISEMQGVGKGTLMEKILAPLVGWHNVSVPTEKELTESAFNSYLVRKRLVLVHEIYAGHSKKAYDSVKSNVTDDNLDVNEKNLKPYSIRNWTHFVLSSNSLLALRMVKGDRRWFVPEVTEEKPVDGAAYWVELNAWLVSGGLEAISDWAHDFVKQHGVVGAGDEAPSSEAKERMIETSRSEGQQMVFDLGEAAAKSPTPYVLKDREVRSWLANIRQIWESHPQLESMLTVRTVLKQSGMIEVAQGKTEGRRWAAFANPAAIDIVGRPPLPKWEQIKGYLVEPTDVLQEGADHRM